MILYPLKVFGLLPFTRGKRQQCLLLNIACTIPYLCMLKSKSILVDVTCIWACSSLHRSSSMSPLFNHELIISVCMQHLLVHFTPYLSYDLVVRCCISFIVTLVYFISNKVIQFQDCLKVRQFLFRGPVSGRACRDLQPLTLLF